MRNDSPIDTKFSLLGPFGMFTGSYEFLKHAATARRNPQTRVCEGITATCGPRGHPCETCMHLKGLHSAADEERDLCLIAPRSLVRPVRYKRYFNRGVTVPPYLPVSRVNGELKEVRTVDPCGPEELQDMIRGHHQKELNFKFQDASDSNTPYLVSHNVFIEHNGKFTKAPKHLLQLGDYTTRVCYLEDIAGPEFESPLDCAIFVQKLWSTSVKIIVGILAGVTLIQTCVVMTLAPNVEEEDLSSFFNTFPKLCPSFNLYISVLAILTLIAMLDWLDFAHMDLQHVWDTYMHRTIWLITTLVVVGYLLFLINAQLNDAFYLHGADWTEWEIRKARDQGITDDLKFRKILYYWEVRLMAFTVFFIFAWILLATSRNDDLFMMHLECMKKYDYDPRRMAHKQELTNPSMRPPAP